VVAAADGGCADEIPVMPASMGAACNNEILLKEMAGIIWPERILYRYVALWGWHVGGCMVWLCSQHPKSNRWGSVSANEMWGMLNSAWGNIIGEGYARVEGLGCGKRAVREVEGKHAKIQNKAVGALFRPTQCGGRLIRTGGVWFKRGTPWLGGLGGAK
jgi:hypothetical protein